MTIKVISSIKLTPVSASQITLDEVNKKLGLVLAESKIRQQACIDQNINTPIKWSLFSESSSRSFTIPPCSPERLVKSRVDRVDKSEAYRLILSYQQRLVIARFMQSHNWDVDYSTVLAEFPYTKFAWYSNIKSSQSLPAKPVVCNAQFPLSKADNQLGSLKFDSASGQVILTNFVLWDKKTDLVFQLPKRWLDIHPQITKVCKPTLVCEYGEVVFVFAVEETVPKPVVSSNVVGFDLGLSKPFSGARISEGRELSPSVHTMRHKHKSEVLETELKRVVAKKKRKEALGLSVDYLQTQEDFLRFKLHRIKAAEDWSVANDIVNHCLPGETIVLENLKWALGGPVKFRHSLTQTKIEHVARRRSRAVTKVKAKNSSHECPVCHAYLKPNSKRVSECSDHWCADRDYTAALVIAQRGAKTPKLPTPKKGRPTPKRPPAINRRLNRFIKAQRNSFTGLSPTTSTGNQIKLVVASVGDEGHSLSLSYQKLRI